MNKFYNLKILILYVRKRSRPQIYKKAAKSNA
jgi:hypothetical protein